MPTFFPLQSTSLAGDAQGQPSGLPALGYAWDSQPGASWLEKFSMLSSGAARTSSWQQHSTTVPAIPLTLLVLPLPMEGNELGQGLAGHRK